MGDLIEYYNKGKLGISFDRKRNGLWLSIGDSSYFISDVDSFSRF